MEMQFGRMFWAFFHGLAFTTGVDLDVLTNVFAGRNAGFIFRYI